MTKEINLEGPVCPVPVGRRGQIILGHGSGGKLSHDLINEMFFPAFDNPTLAAGNDAAIVDVGGYPNLAISTDSHVVKPLFFPGGDIGTLAVCGTVNDLAMMGAQPLYLTAGFILEEGLELAVLEQVVSSMCQAASEAGIKIIAGDTKVVERGKADGMYINTSGIGLVKVDRFIGGTEAQIGDEIILSGPIGDHGIAVLAARGELGFKTELHSDVAPLNHLVQSMIETNAEIHVLRDPTRGGIATALNEIAQQSQVGIMIDEESIPVRGSVKAACELLGFDPIYIANEGRLLAFVKPGDLDRVLSAMSSSEHGHKSAVIGCVTEDHPGRVLMKTAIGTTRIVDMLSGEMLPRIC